MGDASVIPSLSKSLGAPYNSMGNPPLPKILWAPIILWGARPKILCGTPYYSKV